jgi:hypothetical protein
MSNQFYRADEKCRTCNHVPSMHGMWRYIGREEAKDLGSPNGYYYFVTLIEGREDICCGDGNTILCECKKFTSRDNLKYLEQCYESKSTI